MRQVQLHCFFFFVVNIFLNQFLAQYAARWSSFHKSEYDTEVLNFNRVLLQNFFDLFMRVILLYYLFVNITAGKMTVGSIAMLISYQVRQIVKIISTYSFLGNDFWSVVYVKRDFSKY